MKQLSHRGLADMGVGGGEQGSPLDFGILSKKGCFLNFEREKKILPLLAIPWKKIGKIP